jgi:heptosyltransferase II
MVSEPEGVAARDGARLLVRLPNWLGDVLLARPLLHALRASFPRARISGVAPAPLLELLGGDRALDHAHPWPAGGTAGAALVREIRSWRPDVALVLPPSFSSAWFAWRARARHRIGYRSEARGALLTRALTRPMRGDSHLSDEYLDLGRVIGARPAAVPYLELPASARESSRALVEGARDYAVLGPGANFGPAKRWPATRFAAIGRSMRDAGVHVLVCGTSAERGVCDAVAREIGGGARSLAGRTSLLDQAALCAGARVNLCNDSGLAHLSASVGAATVVIFGSTSSSWTAPLGRRVRVVQDAPVCSPCFQRTCRVGYVCLEAVSVSAVEQAAREVAP